MKIPGKCYLVGGTVRDNLLGRETKDRDWVVVGATAEEMLTSGFKPVGSHFPVFLHPTTYEEYALARTEEKSGRGHRGFEVNVNRDITLEQDLRRRDLTINAIAKDSDGTLIDPFGGQKDINDQVIRHVSDAFREDPLRCFRVARFASKLPNFSIASSTMQLLKSMSDELDQLPVERVWVEYKKSMYDEMPKRFYEVLRDAEIQDPWFSDLVLDLLIEFHSQMSLSGFGAFASVPWTQQSDPAIALFLRLKAPKRIQNLIKNVAHQGTTLCQWQDMPATQVLETLTRLQAFLSGTQCEDTFVAIETCAEIDLTPVRELVARLRLIPAPSHLVRKEIGVAITHERIEMIRAAQHADKEVS